MSKTILIADDEASLRLLVKATLALKKYTVIEASNGRDALALIEQARPSLALLDVMMPHLTGFQVCSEVKKDEFLKKIPIIILTAKGGSEDRETATLAGADNFLTKPFRPPALLDAIREILEK